VNENFAYLLERIKLAEIKIDSLVSAINMHDDSISQSVRNSQLPIGTIIGSMLSPADFKTNFPGNASLWKLADSSSVSVADTANAEAEFSIYVIFNQSEVIIIDVTVNNI
jgi:hypothetical protein